MTHTQEHIGIDIPAPFPGEFRSGINHPSLWLWDSWTCETDGELHLYCLALSKQKRDGTPITPPERNNYPFHIRHFKSTNMGQSWRDKGVSVTPGNIADGADDRNVWSGSVLALADGRCLFGFTGIRETNAARQFHQSICFALGENSMEPTSYPKQALSCPLRDYESIVKAGYYLGPKDRLGDNKGEEGGPILAWRDPFFFEDENGRLNGVWAAKIGAARPAIAQAILRLEADDVVMEKLLPPVLLPDEHQFTQAEVPKIYRDDESGHFYLIIAACNRLFEGQPDSEVNQELRLYKSKSAYGPWTPASSKGSLLDGPSFMFGASIIAADFAKSEITLLGPYTENAGPVKQLTFEAPVKVKF